MLKSIQKYGGIIFDYMLITFILSIATLLVFPLIPMIIGLTKYFTTDIEERSLTLIFVTIKQNIKIIWKITLFLLLLFGVSLMNILYLNTGYANLDSIIKVLSYILLIIGGIILIYMPVVVCYMEVNFRELMHNSIMLVFGGFKNLLILIVVAGIFIYLSVYNWLFYILGIYLEIYLISSVSYKSLLNLKEKIK